MVESPSEMRERVSPNKREYSVVLFDTWKQPGTEEYAYKITEIDNLENLPSRQLSKGEELTVYDSEGNIVRNRAGPGNEF
jgi:hypothetical protein